MITHFVHHTDHRRACDSIVIGCVCVRSGLGLGSDILAILKASVSTAASPDAYYRFDDIPLFPIVQRTITPATPPPSTTSEKGAINQRGYSWMCWLKLTRMRDNPTNLFSFLADNGSGVQTYLQRDRVQHIQYTHNTHNAHTN